MDRMHKPTSRLRRWLVALTLLAAGLAAYAWGVSWMAQRLGNDMDRTLHGTTERPED